MNLDLNSLPKSVLNPLRAKARQDNVSIKEAAVALLSDRTALALISANADSGVTLAHRAIRRTELLTMVPLAHTTIYEMELRGDFPSRFYLTPRCAAWDLQEVLDWLSERRQQTMRNATRSDFPGINQATQ